jgi:hypothetical protein
MKFSGYTKTSKGVPASPSSIMLSDADFQNDGTILCKIIATLNRNLFN